MKFKKEKHLVTLFVGIDISKEIFDICQMQEDGEVVKTFQITPDRGGFNRLILSIPKGENPLFVIEKTGPYSGNLEYFMNKDGHNYISCNAFEVSRLREVFSFRTKNDVIDAWVLAQAARLGVLKHSSRGPEYIYLRDILERIYDLKDRKTALLNQIQACVVESFPEISKIFVKFQCNACLAILSQYQTPEQVLMAETKEILKVVRKNNGRISLSKIEELKNLCSESVAWKNNKAYLQITKSLLRELQVIKEEIESILILLNEYINDTFLQEIELLKSVPGIGNISACHMLAIMGDHKRFDHENDGNGAKRVSSFAGYGVVEYSSGQRSKRYGLNKRGDSKLRGLLYMAAITAIRVDPHLATKFGLKKERSNGKKALVSISHLLLRRGYGVLKSGKMYNPAIPMAG